MLRLKASPKYLRVLLQKSEVIPIGCLQVVILLFTRDNIYEDYF